MIGPDRTKSPAAAKADWDRKYRDPAVNAARLRAVRGGLGAAPTLTEFASAALVSAVETIELRTAFSPPVIVKTRDLVGGKPSEKPNPLVAAMKPTIIMRGGILGTQVISPAGVPAPEEWKRNGAIVAGSIGLLVLGTAAVLFAIGVGVGRRGN